MDRKLTRKIPADSIRHYILVDSENTLPDVLDYSEETAIVFFVNHEKRLSVRYLADLQCTVIFESIQSDSKNALDFLIVSYLTEMVMTIPSDVSSRKSICILSEDHGYDCIIEHLQKFYPQFEIFRGNNARLFVDYGHGGNPVKAKDYKNPEMMNYDKGSPSSNYPVNPINPDTKRINTAEDVLTEENPSAMEPVDDSDKPDETDGYSQEIKLMEKDGMVFLFPILKIDAETYHIVGKPTVEIAEMSAIAEAKRVMSDRRKKTVSQELNETIPLNVAIYRAEEMSKESKFAVKHFFFVNRMLIETGSTKSIHKKYCIYCQDRGIKPVSRKKFKKYAYEVCRLSAKSINGIERFYDSSMTYGGIRRMTETMQMKSLVKSMKAFFEEQKYDLCQRSVAESYEKYLFYCRMHHEPAASQKIFEQQTMDHYGYVIKFRKRNKNLSVACFEPGEATIKKYIAEFLDKHKDEIEGSKVSVMHKMLEEYLEQYRCDNVTTGRLNREIKDFFGYEVKNTDEGYIFVSL